MAQDQSWRSLDQGKGCASQPLGGPGRGTEALLTLPAVSYKILD